MLARGMYSHKKNNFYLNIHLELDLELQLNQNLNSADTSELFTKQKKTKKFRIKLDFVCLLFQWKVICNKKSSSGNIQC